MRHLAGTILISSLCVVLSDGAVGDSAAATPRITDLMTAEQYQRTGLDKLSEEELEALDSWLREHADELNRDTDATPAAQGATATVKGRAPAPAVATTPPPVAVDENFGLPEPVEEAAVLHAEVLPPFRGWSGKTVFQLDNGQVWKQRVSGKFTYSGDDRRVVISKNSWGFYVMRLVDADRSVGVKRLK